MGVVSAQHFTNAGFVETGEKGNQKYIEKLIIINRWEIDWLLFLIHCHGETKCASITEHGE